MEEREECRAVRVASKIGGCRCVSKTGEVFADVSGRFRGSQGSTMSARDYKHSLAYT